MNFKEVITYSKDRLVKDKYHATSFIFVKEGRVAKIETTFRSNEEKIVGIKFLKEVIRETKPDYYFFICESWMVKRKYEDADKINLEGIIPSECDDKIQALVIEQFSKDMTKKSCIAEFILDKNNNIVFVNEDIIEEPTEHDYSIFNLYLE